MIMETRVQLLISLSLALASLTSGSDVLDQFQRFKADHGKTYPSTEEESHRLPLSARCAEIYNKKYSCRFQVFQSNLRKISEHNSRPGETWRMAVTEFADLTAEEFRDSVLGGYIRTPQTGHTGRLHSTLIRHGIVNCLNFTPHCRIRLEK